MALYAPAPTYPVIPNLDAPTASSTAPPHQPSPRQISRSERMLIETLRRADQHERSMRGTTPPDDDPDYFSRAMDAAWSRSHSTTASPSRTHKRLPTGSHLAPPTTGSSRAPSPITIRGVERDGAVRRRTPSPSPYPQMSSPRPAQHASMSPNLNRSQTAPSRSQLNPYGSRPSTPSQPPRRSSSPLRSSSHNHHRRESSNGQSVSPAASYQKRSPHEELLRTRLDGVLTASTKQDAVMVDATSNSVGGGRSRGPSFSRTAPPAGTNLGTQASTVTGDQWSWSQQSQIVPSVHLPAAACASPRRSASISHGHGTTPQRTTSSSHLAGMVVSPSRIKDSLMITPPPSPPHNAKSQQQHQAETSPSPLSGSPSRDHSNSRATLGLGRPSAATSRSSSNGPTSCRITPPPFDARSASLALKDQQGYVSFCEIEGLGEPEGMDAEESGDEADGQDAEGRGRGRWWEVWRK